MDNEQLLTNGICPKCYRPLYESKHTDKILCDCGIMTQPMDRLKEIRERYNPVLHCHTYAFTFDTVKEIQQASYNLGRDEVINEIETTLQDALKTAYDGQEVLTAINFKLTSLKEKK